ncbi:LacI family DNA-binding transcriptional regulator [uncultured Muribaculum sp.]|uniref:LacI family DNA-binding transcriptional regulator n=1 Tax=uncultured Muribaculum sp. TaxID=1918613 RepID=UPI00266F71E9|nr:LacI family DNA-binding transcriptional regulator [uncultured Muribaculum sp.]
MRYVTIKDIADALKISKSSVSRALSGDIRNVSPATVERVRAKALEMGYRRNTLAVNLRAKASKIIGILVPEITTPFFMTFVTTVQEAVQPLGYRVLIAVSSEDPKRERQNIDMFKTERIDGILVSVTHNQANRDLFENLVKSDFPLVFFDRTIKNMRCSSVCSNDELMSFFLVEHLIRTGRKRIVNMTGPSYIENSYARSRAYREALDKFHIPYDPQLVVAGGMTVEDGAMAIEKLIRKGIAFDAIYCFTETQALGAKRVLQERNISIPESVSICTMSGTTLSSFVYPQITAVEQNVVEMARVAVRLLLEKIEVPNAPQQNIVLHSSLIVRGSSSTEE